MKCTEAHNYVKELRLITQLVCSDKVIHSVKQKLYFEIKVHVDVFLKS